MFPQIPVVVGDNPLMWAVFIVLAALALGLSRMILTLSRVASVEVWARFIDRHRNASNKVRKLIESSSKADLDHPRWVLPRRQQPTNPD